MIAALDRSDETIRARAPQPCPPADARPRVLSVTRVETLLRDPYAIYASKILKLDKLDALGVVAGPAEIGRLFHAVFEDYVRQLQSDAPDLALAHAIFKTHAEAYGFDAEEQRFWGDRLDMALQWFVEWHHARLSEGAPALIEGEGGINISASGEAFRITARADRIDLLKDGTARIFDYKTGAPPTLKQEKTFSPQLPITGLIVERGGFEKLGERRVQGFDYLRTLSRRNDGKDDVGSSGERARELIAEAETHLKSLIDHFDDPSTSYPSQPRAEYVARFGDYDHLARRRERETLGSDE